MKAVEVAVTLPNLIPVMKVDRAASQAQKNLINLLKWKI